MENYSQTEFIHVIIGVMRSISKILAAIITRISITNAISRAQISVITSTSIILYVALSLLDQGMVYGLNIKSVRLA